MLDLTLQKSHFLPFSSILFSHQFRDLLPITSSIAFLVCLHSVLYDILLCAQF